MGNGHMQGHSQNASLHPTFLQSVKGSQEKHSQNSGLKAIKVFMRFLTPWHESKRELDYSLKPR
jgi:hypothetical protein